MSDNNNNNNDQPDTTIEVERGTDVRVGGVGRINVLVIDYEGDGRAEYEELPAGATVRDVVGDTRDRTVSVNGERASADTPLEDGDKITTSPESPEGGC